MALTASELHDFRDALIRARASDAREVTYTAANGVSRHVVYRTDNEMAAALRDIEARIALAEGRGPRFHVIHSHKGYWDNRGA